ncbi:MAG: hypothetical protein JKY84_00960 [Emcibacteraceae bacterium]|nr:hypothetical protein [Emcibacteraceae bacterium]
MAIKRPLSILEDYDLFQAYYLLGIRMYGDKWDGFNELHADKDETSIEAIEDKHNKNIKERNDLQEERKALERNKARQTDPEKIQAIEEMIRSLWDKSNELAYEQIEPSVIQHIREREEKYVMRITVENTLIKALKEKQIKYWAVRGMLIDSRVWEKVDGCGYDIELSIIWWGKKVQSGTRRQFVRISKSPFDLWLNQHYPIIDPDDVDYTKNVLAESWLIEQLKKQAELKWRRDDYIDHMMSEIGISKRHALQLWAIHASDEMKKAGRRKSIRP